VKDNREKRFGGQLREGQMPKKKYIVALTAEERAALERLTKTGKALA